MKNIILILTLLYSISACGQDNDTAWLKKNIIGEWELLFILDLDTNGVVVDTIKTDSMRTTIGLKINKKSVDEIWNFWDYPDSTAKMGKGEWELRNRGKSREQWIDFDCEGLFLCGYFQFISLKNDILILKSCSMYDYEGCQLDYLKRKK